MNLNLTKNIYQKFVAKELSLQDQLAVARTVLANERSLLAFIRTSFSLLIAGITFIRFFEYASFIILGWIMLPLSLIVLTSGIIRYKKMKSLIHDVELNKENQIISSSGNIT